MTPVAVNYLDQLHSAATQIFTGAIESCNIPDSFDRRIRIEGSRMIRLIPDGSGPEVACSWRPAPCSSTGRSPRSSATGCWRR